MTQLEAARAGKITAEMKRIAKYEGLSADSLRRSVARGRVVIPKNIVRTLAIPCGIGEGLKTKVNANIGTSKDSSDIKTELRKMREAVKLGSDTIMDLSTGALLNKTRAAILAKSKVPVGTVPLYEIVIKGLNRHGTIEDITIDEMFAVLEDQAAEGVDFFTIHAGVVKKALDILKKKPRVLDIVSRGGAFLARWMLANNEENPFYTHFDRVIDIARRYDITLSLGDGMRPGAIADASDRAQIHELLVLGQLQRRAVKRGVQVMIEGPGHVPLNQIEANVILQKSVCNNAPFYVLGPLVTDIAPGYDHLTAAIGGALAAAKGADYLCYVTPAEHLRLPTIEDVREGVIATKIAAHAGDIAKGVRGAAERDMAMSKARRDRNWAKQFDLAIDHSKPKLYRKMSRPGLKDVCTMCGEYCSIKLSEKCFRGKQ